MAAGMQSHGVGSFVPVQSNSRRKRDVSRRGALAPIYEASIYIREQCSTRVITTRPNSFGWDIPGGSIGAIAIEYF